MSGGTGNDTYLVDNAGDTATEVLDEGTDTVQSSVSFTLGANVENLILTGTADINGTGNGLANTITATPATTRSTAAPAPTPWSAATATTPMASTTPADVVTEVAGQGTDTVQSSISYTLGANVENLSLTGTGNINGTGNADANTITGNSGNNILAGGGGNDTFIVQNAGDVVTEALNEGTDTVQSSVSFALGANVENLTLTGGGNVNGTGNGDANTITGNTGNNILTGGGGADTLVGGTGTDTAAYTAAITSSAVTSDGTHFLVNAGPGEGTDTLSGIEKIDGAGSANILLVGNGGYATIQAAINAAANGDTIMVAAGSYAENLVVDKGVTIVGLGNVTIQGTFETDNGIAGNVSDFLTTAPSYSGAAGDGVTIAASNVTLSNINIDGFVYGVHFASDVGNTTLTNVDISDSVVGIEKSAGADIDGLTITGGSFVDGYIGIDFAKDIGVGQASNGLATNVTISGTHFEDMTAKGIYVEALSHALITGVTMDHVGFWGAGTAFGTYAGVGIELNLKNGVYQDVTITGFDLTDTGVSDNGSGSHNNAAAISVKTRDDGGNAATPATWTGDPVVVSNGTINGTSTGVRAGETGQNVAGPPVDVSGVTITGALHNGQNGDVENVSQSPMMVIGTDGADTYVASPQSTGPIVMHGGLGADALTGGSGDDTFEYDLDEDGADTIDGGLGSDTLDYTGSTDAVTVDLGEPIPVATGIASLTSIENVTGGSGADNLTGNADANTLAGGSGNDELDGADGTDTAAYTTTLTLADLVFTPGVGWTVNGGAGNSDALSGIEFVEHVGGRFVLIDPLGTNGFVDEQAAVDAGAGTRPGDAFVYATAPASVDFTLDTDLNLDITIPYDVPTTITVTGDGEVHVTTGSGNDFIVTGDGNDTIHTGDGNDVVQTGLGDDEIVGGQGGGDDIYDGGPGDNAVSYPSATNSILIDLNTADRSEQTTLNASTIGAVLTAGGYPNPDMAVGYAEGVDIGTDVLIDIDNATGGAGNDNIIGNGGANVLSGGLGIDTITAGAGADTILYTVGDGVNSIDGEADTDTLAVSGTAGDDTIDVVVVGGLGGSIFSIEGMTPTSVENYTLDGLANGTAGDTLSYASTAGSVLVNLATGSATGFTSIAGIENVTGGSAFDTLTGDTGNNTLDGGALNDALAGGAGDDTYIVDHAGDAVTEAADQGTDTVQSSVSFTLGNNVENLTLTGGGNINGTGNGDANILTGNSGDNQLNGMVGADTMSGGAGNDIYVVDNAGDVVTEAPGGGVVDQVQSSISYALGADVERLILTGSDNIDGAGNGDANIIIGNSGNNILAGGGGNDILADGGGTDTAAYTATTITAAMVSDSGGGSFVVTTGGAEGTDFLTGIEIIDGAGTANILLVGNGGFATIQAAIIAAERRRHHHDRGRAADRERRRRQGRDHSRRQPRRVGHRHPRGGIRHRRRLRDHGGRRRHRRRPHRERRACLRQLGRGPRQRQQRHHHQLGAAGRRRPRHLCPGDRGRRQHHRPRHQQQPDRRLERRRVVAAGHRGDHYRQHLPGHGQSGPAAGRRDRGHQRQRQYLPEQLRSWRPHRRHRVRG